MRKTWLIFSQAVTVALAVLFVVATLKPEWLKLYTDFPDRVIIGSDQHFDPPATAPLARAQQNALLLNQLPPDVRKKIAIENALRIYGR